MSLYNSHVKQCERQSSDEDVKSQKSAKSETSDKSDDIEMKDESEEEVKKD